MSKTLLGIIQMDAFNALLAQLWALNNQMQNLENKTQASAQAAQAMPCEFCRNNYPWEQCPMQEEIENYTGDYNWNHCNLYSNTYSLGWRNHPNFRWGGNQAGGQKPQAQVQARPQVQAPLGLQANAQNILQ